MNILKITQKTIWMALKLSFINAFLPLNKVKTSDKIVMGFTIDTSEYIKTINVLASQNGL